MKPSTIFFEWKWEWRYFRFSSVFRLSVDYKCSDWIIAKKRRLLPCKGSLVRNRGFKRTWIRVFVRPAFVRRTQKLRDLPNGICAGFIQPGRYNISSGPKRDPKRLSFKARMEPFSGTPKKLQFFRKIRKVLCPTWTWFLWGFRENGPYTIRKIANVDNKIAHCRAPALPVRVLSSLGSQKQEG